MLVVFEFSSVGELSEYMYVAKHANDVQNEELDYCLGREKAHEILACRDLKIPYVVLERPTFFRKEDERSSGQAIIDCNVDVSALDVDTRLVYRTLSSNVDCEALKRFRPFITEEANHAVTHWPTSIKNPAKYLKREVTELSATAFNGGMRTGAFNLPFFLKGVEKGSGLSLRHVIEEQSELDALVKTAGELRRRFGQMVPITAKDDDFVAYAQMPDWECPYRGDQKGRVYFFQPKEGVIISSVLKFDHKPDHKAEYRCFIVDGKVSSISTYTDYVAYPVPEMISKMACEFAADNADLAPGFVADFGVTDRGPVMIELNSFSQSGRYIGNDAFALYRDLDLLLGADRSSIKKPVVSVPTHAYDNDDDVSVGRYIHLQDGSTLGI